MRRGRRDLSASHCSAIILYGILSGIRNLLLLMKESNEDRSLNAIIKKSIEKNWNKMALSDVGGINYQYKDLAEQIAKLHIIFDAPV